VRGNGGLHAFPVAAFTTTPPTKPEEAQALSAKNSKGEKALFRAPVRTEAQATNCTAHVFHQIPGQNRIFMAWYSQGTQVIDFTENADGTIDFKNAAWFIPENANEWVSQVFKVQRNADGTWTYWGVTGDFALGDNGRNAMDIYKVTLPAPPTPKGGEPRGTPQYPVSPLQGVESEVARSNPPACARTTAFDRIDLTTRGRRLDFKVQRRGSARIRLDVFRVTRGSRVVREQVADTTRKGNSFSFSLGKALRPGYYVARLRTATQGQTSDVRHFGLRLTRKGFARQASIQEHVSCQLIEEAELGRPVFGGTTNEALGISFKTNDHAKVSVEIRRAGKVVKRFAAKSYLGKKLHRLQFKARARGLYTVIIKATAGGRSHTTALGARRI
jgi:hypothetical protein